MKSGAIGRSKKIPAILTPEKIKLIFINVIYFISGIMVSRGAVFGNFAPFGVSLVVAAPYNNVWWAFAGAILGYIMPSEIGGNIRYISAAIAVLAIRWTLNDLKRIKKHPLFAPIVVFIPMLLTGLAVSSVEGFSANAVVMSITEAMLSAGATYFFSRTASMASGPNSIRSLNQQELACFAITCCVLILSLSRLSIGDISIGRIAAIFIILMCSKYSGISGGSIAGISCGAIFSLSEPGAVYLAGAYAFGGMISGLFSPFGKVATVIAFMLSNSIAAVQAGELNVIILEFYEVLIASAIFIIIPNSISGRFAGLFAVQSNQLRADGLRKSILMRLKFASDALSSVTDSVEIISRKLSEMNTPNLNEVCKRATSVTCQRCGLRVFCWEKDYDETSEIFDNITDILYKRGAVYKNNFPQKFSNNCCKITEMIDNINGFFEEFSVREAAQRRTDEIRKVIADQFSGMGDILKDISEEFKGYEWFDTVAEERIFTMLKLNGLFPVDVSCRIDRCGRMSVEIEILETDKNNIDEFYISEDISKICGREMDLPCISFINDKYRIQLSQRPIYDVEIGSCQHVCNNGKLCGDSYKFFNDGQGKVMVIISDGMGTGGRAAVDGAMASEIMSSLSKAGLGFDCAVKIVNSALLAKSGEESLSTLDILCIDLFSGKSELLKAGAPLTFVKKSEKVSCIDSSSLPLGILTDVSFSRDERELRENDWILMISDGAIATGDKWIEEEFRKFKERNPQVLAEKIVDEAIKRRTDGHDDDITALAIRISPISGMVRR